MDQSNCLFETSWWLDAIASDNWHTIIYEENNNILARWVVVKEGKNIGMPKYTQTLGIWFSKEVLDKDITLNKRKEIILHLIQQLPTYANLKIYLDPTNDYFLPFYWSGFQITPNITYRINHETSLDAVYNKFSKNIKRDIKNAGKIVQVHESDDIEKLIELIVESYAKQKRAYAVNPTQIRKMYTASKQNHAGKLLSAIDANNQTHSMAFFVYDSRVCYYMLAGNNAELNKKSCANTLILWEAIKFSSTVSSVFDFEGSMVQPIEHFFRRFGAIPTVYYEIRKQRLHKQLIELIKPMIKRLLRHK